MNALTRTTPFLTFSRFILIIILDGFAGPVQMDSFARGPSGNVRLILWICG
jgi:hypothetical protein